MYRYFNPNPLGKETSDCVVRAICAATGKPWNEVYLGLMQTGFELKEMPSSNSLWREYLHRLGFVRTAIPDTCPDCYTVRDFCEDHQQGRFILATGTHAIGVVSGDYLDIWDSGNKTPIFFWR